MRRHREINWSEVVRKAIEEYLQRLGEAKRVEAPGELVEKLRELGLSAGDLEPPWSARRGNVREGGGVEEGKTYDTGAAIELVAKRSANIISGLHLGDNSDRVPAGNTPHPSNTLPQETGLPLSNTLASQGYAA
ncbi:hypothetical protein PYJP_06420 [Pyrofollis japonicus]|nr:hypothetical protein PYJP_06420 [Pyrofollis japonicus]